MREQSQSTIKLYVFLPKEGVDKSFFVMARNKTLAIKAMLSHLGSFQADKYKLIEANIGQVLEV